MVKVALLIGVSEYQAGLNPLPAAVKDIKAMQRVLLHPEMGSFDQVDILQNPEPQAMQEAIEALFSDRKKNDLVLLFFSGHGIKDDSGKLYFATRSTRKTGNGELIKATTVPASFVQDIMSNSRCKRQVVLLDCCFSGAFAEGMMAKDGGIVNVKEELGGEGRVILTSSTSTQYSFEQQGVDLSIYTRYIVEGIETGVADIDSDGFVSIDELHGYASKKVQEVAPAMKPKIYAVEEGFKIRLAKASIGDPKLKYRKEVEQLISSGEISPIGRSILYRLQEQLGLTSEEVTAIETEVSKPYRDYQQNLQKYKQLYTEIISYENPLSNESRNELKRYQEVLHLAPLDIKRIEDTLNPKEQKPAIKLAWLKWTIPGLMVVGIVGVALFIDKFPPTSTPPTPPTPSPLQVEEKYKPLQQALLKNNWQQADIETTRILLEVADKITPARMKDWLEPSDINKIPCSDLKTVNQLWSDATKNHFGLVTQSKVWQNVGGTTATKPDSPTIRKKFSVELGWQGADKPGQFNLDALYKNLKGKELNNLPKGYLPSTIAKFEFNQIWVGDLNEFAALTAKLQKCGISQLN